VKIDQLEFNAEAIRSVWEKIYGERPPKELSIKQIYEACLMEIGSQFLRDELKKGDWNE